MDEAHWISGLKQTQWTQFNDTAYLCAYLLKDFFAQTGIVLWDGKCEFASYYQQDGSWQLVLVDSIGPDELRLTRQGQLLSKEVLRDFYRHSEWYIELERAKVQARNEHVQDWKKLCALTPVPLPRTLKENAEAIYSDLARELKESLQRYQAQELL
jgi:phosphoribosylaminoimidazole-succinocarboxamide synthase